MTEVIILSAFNKTAGSSVIIGKFVIAFGWFVGGCGVLKCTRGFMQVVVCTRLLLVSGWECPNKKATDDCRFWGGCLG